MPENEAEMPASAGAYFPRRWVADQALISSRIEGFEPDATFLERREDWIAGRVSADQWVAEMLAELGPPAGGGVP